MTKERSGNERWPVSLDESGVIVCVELCWKMGEATAVPLPTSDSSPSSM